MSSLDRLIKATLPSVPFLKRDHEVSSLRFRKTLSGPIDKFGNPTGEEWLDVKTHLYLVTGLERSPNAAQSQTDRTYRGHCWNPLILPDWIEPGAGGICTLGERSYSFTLNSIDRTAMPAYSANFGERIEISVFTDTKSY